MLARIYARETFLFYNDHWMLPRVSKTCVSSILMHGLAIFKVSYCAQLINIFQSRHIKTLTTKLFSAERSTLRASRRQRYIHASISACGVHGCCQGYTYFQLWVAEVLDQIVLQGSGWFCPSWYPAHLHQSHVSISVLLRAESILFSIPTTPLLTFLVSGFSHGLNIAIEFILPSNRIVLRLFYWLDMWR